MAFYSGQVKINVLYDTIVNNIKSGINAATPTSSWVVHYSTTNDIVFKSVGSSTKDNLYVRLTPGNSKGTTGNYIDVTVADNVSSVDGTYPSGAVYHTKQFKVHSSAVDTNLLVDYQVSDQADRFLFYALGDTASSTGLSNLCYAGLIKRYAAETNSTALGIGLTHSGDNGIRCLKDAVGGITNNIYDAFATTLPSNPGWGNLYHTSPIIMANDVEGARGELMDIVSIPSAGVNQGDEVTINSVVYKVFSFSIGGGSFLPGSVAAVRMA